MHRQRRLVDGDHRQRLGHVDRGDRGADAQVIDAGDEHDVARRGRLDRQALQSGKTKQLYDFGPGPGLTAVKDHHFLPRRQSAAADAADTKPADVAGIIERADLQL